MSAGKSKKSGKSNVKKGVAKKRGLPAARHSKKHAIEKEIGWLKSELSLLRQGQSVKHAAVCNNGVFSGKYIFYTVFSIIFLGILSFLFGSAGNFIVYLISAFFIWWVSKQFHSLWIHVSLAIPAFMAIGLGFYMMYMILGNLLSLILFLIYVLSFLIAIVLFFVHSRNGHAPEHSFSSTFIVTLYSHIAAFASASIFAYVFMRILVHDSFFSMSSVIFVWLFPSLLIYFFLAKFLYLRFFDKVHIRRELLKGLKHSVVYSLAFVILMLIAYFSAAFQTVTTEEGVYDSIMGSVLDDLDDLGLNELSTLPDQDSVSEFTSLEVFQDLMYLRDQVINDANEIDISHDFSINEYGSDDYFIEVVGDGRNIFRLWSRSQSVLSLKREMFREYRTIKSLEEGESSFEDGSLSLADHRRHLEDFIDKYSVPLEYSYRLSRLRERVKYVDSYDHLFGDGDLVDFNMHFHPWMEFVSGADSRFGDLMLFSFKHTIVFRELMLLVFDSIDVQFSEIVTPYAVTALNRQGHDRYFDESLLSQVIRYRIIKKDIEATLALAD